MKKIIIFLFCCFVTFSYSSPAEALLEEGTNEMQQTNQEKMLEFENLQVELPGFSLEEAVKKSYIDTKTDTSKSFTSSFLALYITAVFRYALIVISILAVIFTMFSGLQWMTSGGNRATIQQAQTRIQRSIIAIIIAVTAYTLLNVINTRLTQLQSLEVEFVPAIDWAIGNEDVENPTDPPLPDSVGNPTPVSVEPGKMSYGYNNVPYFAQGAEPWGPMHYGPANCSATYRSGSCGPTSIAMVLRHLGKEVDPRNIGAIAESLKLIRCGVGTTMTKDLVKAIEEKYNVSIKWINSHEDALALLRQGKPLVQSGSQIGFTNKNTIKSYKGHYIVLTGTETINGKEIIRVNDSARRSPSEGIVYKTIELHNQTQRGFLYIQNK
ncbi:MAG: C39 family peptidase [Candidatus Magasanikbacteria bacterium]